MKTLKESLLGNIEDALRNNNDMNSEFNIDTIPTVKDFEKGIFNRKLHKAVWYCPNIINKYRSKYSDMIPADVDSIMVALDASYGRVVDCNLYFCNGKDTYGMRKLKTIVGWNEGFVGANLRKYKQMAIDVLNKLAMDPKKMDELLAYSNEYRLNWETKNMRIKSFNEL